MANIKIGSATLTGVETVRFKNADDETQYVNFGGNPLVVNPAAAPIAADNGKFCIDSSNNMYRVTAESSDTFSVKSTLPGYTSSTLAYGNGIFVYLVSISDYYYVYYSTNNGNTWTRSASIKSSSWGYATITFWNGKFYFADNNNEHTSGSSYKYIYIYSSTDCKTWTLVQKISKSYSYQSNGSVYLLPCTDRLLFIYFDEYTGGSSGSEYYTHTLYTTTGDSWVAGGYIMSWTDYDIGKPCYHNGTILLPYCYYVSGTGYESIIKSSTDGGISWTSLETLSYRITSIDYFYNNFICFDNMSKKIYKSTSGTGWVDTGMTIGNYFSSSIVANNKLYLGGASGSLGYTTDLVTYTALTIPSVSGYLKLVTNGTQILGFGTSDSTNLLSNGTNGNYYYRKLYF